MEDFELDTYLAQNLKVKKYNKAEKNYYLEYDTHYERWFLEFDTKWQSHLIYFEKIDDDVIETLTKKGITMRELREAYRGLGWL